MGALWVFAGLVVASPFAAALMCALIHVGKTRQPPRSRFVNVNGVWYPRAHVDAMDLRRPPAA